MSEDKKTKYRGFTPAQAEAHKRYMKDFIEIKVRMKAEKRSIVQEHAASMGESATAFINRAIDETMERDSQKQEWPPPMLRLIRWKCPLLPHPAEKAQTA